MKTPKCVLYVAMLAIGLHVGSCHRVAAQDAPAELPKIQVFHLKFAEAESAAETLMNTLPDDEARTVAVDKRMNALIVRGDKETVEEVTQLLEVIDAERRIMADTQIKVFSIEPLRPIDVIDILQRLATSAKFAVNDDRNLIAQGSAEDLELVEALLQAIIKAKPKPTEDITAEIMWLSEASVPGGQRLEGDLARKLTDRGFKELAVMSVIEVATRLGASCEASGAAASGQIKCQFDLNATGEEITMDLHLDAQCEIDDRVEQVTLESTLTTPLDRWIVFGVAQRSNSEIATRARDLFLVRIKPTELLE